MPSLGKGIGNRFTRGPFGPSALSAFVHDSRRPWTLDPEIANFDLGIRETKPAEENGMMWISNRGCDRDFVGCMGMPVRGKKAWADRTDGSAFMEGCGNGTTPTPEDLEIPNPFPNMDPFSSPGGRGPFSFVRMAKKVDNGVLLFNFSKPAADLTKELVPAKLDVKKGLKLPWPIMRQRLVGQIIGQLVACMPLSLTPGL